MCEDADRSTDTAAEQAGELWRQWHAALRRAISQRVPDSADVDDILHEVFVKLRLHLGDLRDRDRVAPWLFRIARNAIADHFRARRGWEELPDALPAPEPADCSADLTRCLHPMIDSLPEIYRQAVRLSEIEGLSQRAVAERLGLSLSGAKSRVQRGREQLRARLLERCHVDTAADVPTCRPRPGGRPCC